MPVATLNVLDKTKMVTMSTTVAQLVERTLEATPSPLPASKHAPADARVGLSCLLLAGHQAAGVSSGIEAPEIGAGRGAKGCG